MTINGIEVPAHISVIGGTYSIGCTDTFTNDPDTIEAGDTVCVRHQTSAAFSTEKTSTLTVGGYAATFRRQLAPKVEAAAMAAAAAAAQRGCSRSCSGLRPGSTGAVARPEAAAEGEKLRGPGATRRGFFFAQRALLRLPVDRQKKTPLCSGAFQTWQQLIITLSPGQVLQLSCSRRPLGLQRPPWAASRRQSPCSDNHWSPRFEQGCSCAGGSSYEQSQQTPLARPIQLDY